MTLFPQNYGRIRTKIPIVATLVGTWMNGAIGPVRVPPGTRAGPLLVGWWVLSRN